MKQILEGSDSFRKSLRFRMIVASVVVQLLVLTLMVGNSIRQSNMHLTALTHTRVGELSETLAISLAAPLAARDHATLRSLIDRLVTMPDVTYLAVLDPSGRIMVHSGDVPAPLPTPVPAIDSNQTVHHVRTQVELFGQTYGHIHYGLSLLALHRAKAEMLFQGSVIAAIEIILSMAALSLITFLLTRRLETLTRASARLAAGDYDAAVGIKGHDEVAVLSSAFNAMVSAVRDQFKRLEDNAAVLRRSNTELTRMAEVTAHHLQEPVRRVVSYSQLLQRRFAGQLGKDGAEFIGVVVDDGLRMKRLLVDLQGYVSIGLDPRAGGARVDLGKSVAEAMLSLQADIADSGAKITMTALPTVEGDANQLSAVFLHLLDNAIVHRVPGTAPQISVSYHASNGSEIICVRDNGPGIPAAYHKRVFELFERLESLSPGTGIGLAMVRKIVETHGGHTWIEPNASTGTAVCFTLPSLRGKGH